MEKSLVFIKPDGVKRGLVGRIISRFEDRGMTLEQASLMTLSDDKIDAHYAEHVERSFYPSLKEYIKSGPVLVMVISGEGVIAAIRKMVGVTNPAEAESGSIRGDFALTTSFNIIHASDSSESAEREIANFF